MTGALAIIYSETLIAQTGLMRIADTLPTLPQDPALWNEVEEALDAAAERFRAFRESTRLAPPKTYPPPGLAGACGASRADSAVIVPICQNPA